MIIIMKQLTASVRLLFITLMMMATRSHGEQSASCFPLQVARMYSQNNHRYYYSYNYASTPRTLTLNLTCANPNHMVKLQGEVHYTIPSHSQDYCADLNQNCTVEQHCKCCTLKPNIQTCMKKMDISLNNYCVDVKGSCSLTVPRKEFTNEDCEGMDYECDTNKPGGSSNCYARWVNVQYQCLDSEAEKGDPAEDPVVSQQPPQTHSKPGTASTTTVVNRPATEAPTTTSQATTTTVTQTITTSKVQDITSTTTMKIIGEMVSTGKPKRTLSTRKITSTKTPTAKPSTTESQKTTTLPVTTTTIPFTSTVLPLARTKVASTVLPVATKTVTSTVLPSNAPRDTPPIERNGSSSLEPPTVTVTRDRRVLKLETTSKPLVIIPVTASTKQDTSPTEVPVVINSPADYTEIYIGVAVAVVLLTVVLTVTLLCCIRKRKAIGRKFTKSTAFTYYKKNTYNNNSETGGNHSAMSQSPTSVTMVSQATNTPPSLVTTPDVIPDYEYTPLVSVTSTNPHLNTVSQTVSTTATSSSKQLVPGNDYKYAKVNKRAVNSKRKNSDSVYDNNRKSFGTDMVENNYYESQDVDHKKRLLSQNDSNQNQLKKNDKRTSKDSDTASYQEINDLDLLNQNSESDSVFTNHNTNRTDDNDKLTKMGLKLSDYYLDKSDEDIAGVNSPAPPMFRQISAEKAHNLSSTKLSATPQAGHKQTHVSIDIPPVNPIRNRAVTNTPVSYPGFSKNELQKEGSDTRDTRNRNSNNEEPYDYDYTYSHFESEGRHRSPYLAHKK